MTNDMDLPHQLAITVAALATSPLIIWPLVVLVIVIVVVVKVPPEQQASVFTGIADLVRATHPRRRRRHLPNSPKATTPAQR